MTTNDAPKNSTGRWVITGMLVAGAGAGLWLALPDSPRTAHETIADTASPQAGAAETPGTPALPGHPASRISDGGRLRVDLDALREGEVMVLALDLPDEARGDGALHVKVVDVAGRLFETEATSIEGSGHGLRLEIDPEWLEPGRYMIQVETAENHPLALRRYVLEVTVDGRIVE